MVITIAGGGSTFTAGIVKSIALRREELEVDEIRLFDINKERQDKVAVVVDWVLHKELNTDIKLVVTTDDTQQPEIKTVEDFLNSIENQQLYQILVKVDKLTLQIALLKIQGYSTREIAHSLNITEKAVYRRMDRLKEKLKKFFE